MDKSKEYKLYWNEEMSKWICVSEDLQEYAEFGEDSLKDPGMAPICAVMEIAKYNVSVMLGEM